MKAKHCPVCNLPIKGRKDKIYCSPNCKSAAQYEARQKNESFYFQVEKQLKTNRKILKKHNQAGKTILRRSVLHEKGFNPNFFTHYWKNKKSDVYFFCYEFGFKKLEEKSNIELKKKYLIVEWQDYMYNHSM